MESTAVQKYANELAQYVETAWRRVGCNEDGFPTIAAQALEAFPFPKQLDAEALFRYGFFFRDKAHQSNPGYAFGEPPLVLCRRELFEVGVLFWLDGTTSIHQHAFSGAFQVLEGSSLHSLYDFQVAERVNERLLFGKLTSTRNEFLKARDIRAIRGGDTFIHSLFHLACPSITLIIRTHAETCRGPQYSYWRPGIAFDPFHETPELILRTRLFKSLLAIEHPSVDEMTKEVFRCGTLEENLRLLLASGGLLRERDFQTRGLLDLVVSERTDLRPMIESFLDELLRVQNIAARRKEIVTEDHRFFLALLLNLPDRKSILEAIQWRMGTAESPTTVLMSWMAELTTHENLAESKLGIALDKVKAQVLHGLLLQKDGVALRDFVSERLSACGLPFVEKEFQVAKFVLPELKMLKPLFR